MWIVFAFLLGLVILFNPVAASVFVVYVVAFVFLIGHPYPWCLSANNLAAILGATKSWEVTFAYFAFLDQLVEQ